MNANQVFWFSLLNGHLIEVDISNFDEIFDIVENLVCRCDLLRKFPFMNHIFASKKREDENISEKS